MSTAILALWMATNAPSALAVNACVQSEGGIGGTGAPSASGIGGTGAPGASGLSGTGVAAGGIGGTGTPLESGIGGTGAPVASGIGGTGIVGTITGFASVCIGDLEVHYDDNTPVSNNGVAGSIRGLAIGQVVAIEAANGSRGLTARSIAVLNALEGPVTRIDAARGTIEVMGQPVRPASGVPLASLALGSSVRISGQRNASGMIIASRIEAAPDLHEASVIGIATTRNGTPAIDGVAVAGNHVGSGEVLVRGSWDGKRLTIREARKDPSLPFAGRVREVVIDGRVQRRSGNEISIGNLRVEIGNGTRIDGGDAREGVQVRIRASLDSENRIRATRVQVERSSGPSRSHGGEGSNESNDDRNSDDSQHGGDDDRAKQDHRGRDDGKDRNNRSDEDRSSSRDRGPSDRGRNERSSDKPERTERGSSGGSDRNDSGRGGK